MINAPKKQLRSDLKTLREMIDIHGGETTLFDAHDRTSIALDFLRGSCIKRRGKSLDTESTNNTEYESWI
jgi:hypothetical protein